MHADIGTSKKYHYRRIFDGLYADVPRPPSLSGNTNILLLIYLINRLPQVIEL